MTSSSIARNKLSGRATKVLGRFPQHLEAAAKGKLLAATVNTVVRDQDIQAADTQQIRIAHRVFEAKQISDLLLLAGLHGIRKSDMAILYARQQKACDLLMQIKLNIDAEGDEAERSRLAESLLNLFALNDTNLLGLFSAVDPESTDFDLIDAIDKLVPFANEYCQTNTLLEAIRTRIVEICAIHNKGNGTIAALLRGAANLLDLNIGPIEHSEDRYWHAAPVHDRLSIRHLNENGGAQAIAPSTEYFGIEENPKATAERGPTPRKHAELFHYLRKGFEDAVLEINIQGMGNRTLSPMFVNRDQGHGVGFFGIVPDGQSLIFTQGGRAVLNGSDVTSRCYAWQGACFAENAAEILDSGPSISTDRNDFVFADANKPDSVNSNTAHFVNVTPAGALGRSALLPHAGASLPMPNIGIGKTRFAYFVQHGHFSALIANTAVPLASDYPSDVFASKPLVVRDHIELVTPRFGAGFADASVFATRGNNAETDAAGKLSLRWLERQAYKVKLLIPNRFRLFDDSNGNKIKDLVKQGVKRFRPAGIDVEVDFVEPFWLIGDAALPGELSDISAIDQIRSQTVLSPVPEES